MEDEVSGIVTAVKMQPNPIDNIYTILSDRTYQLRSNIDLKLMEKISGKASGGALEGVRISGQATEEEYRAAIDNLLKDIIDTKRLEPELEGRKYCDLVEKMLGSMQEAARTLVEGFISGAPIAVRFHNDGDGATAGIGLYRALSIIEEKFSDGKRGVSWQMNKSIAYTTESFYHDELRFKGFSSVAKPIILITDFGTSEESLDAIGLAKDKYEFIWIDHHKPFDGFPRQDIRHYLNTWDFGGDSSLSAGALTCLFAKLISDIKADDLIEASFVSDYSPYADPENKKASETALVLDFFTSKGNSYPPVTPKHIDEVITDSEKSNEALSRARFSLEEAIRTGLNNIKKYKNPEGLNIYSLDFSHIAALGLEYPLPGRYSSKLQAHLESLNSGKTMTIVHYGSFISMRLSRDMLEKLDILGLISQLKKSDDTVAGGGHREAASIRTTKDRIPAVMKLLLIELGAKLE